MGKRVAIISIAILVLCLAGIACLVIQARKVIFTDPYRAVSKEACLILETIDLNTFLNSISSDRGFTGEIAKMKGLESFYGSVKSLKEVTGREDFRKLLTDTHSVISFYPGGRGNLVPLISMAVPASLKMKELKVFLSSAGISNVVNSKFKNKSLQEFTCNTGLATDSVYIALASGLLLCSSSARIIEEAIVQEYKKDDIRDLPGYSRVWTPAGKKGDNLFVVFPNLARFLKSVLSEEQPLADAITRLAGEAEGDIYISENGMVLSGYTDVPDSSDILYAYKDVVPKQFNASRVLPSSTVLYETIVMPPQGHVSVSSGNPKIFSLASKLREVTGDQVTRAVIDMHDSTATDNILFVYELKNSERAVQVFLSEESGIAETEFFTPDDQVKIPVYKVNLNGLAGSFAPGFDRGYDESYFAFYDNFMVSGGSYKTVAKFLYDNLLNKTLANDTFYRGFETSLPSNAGYFFYCVPARITGYLSGIVNGQISLFLKNNRDLLSKIKAIGYQFASSNGMLYNSLSVRYNKEEVAERPDTEWETLLDAEAAVKPFFFTNHLTGAKEIFIQDVNNNTYLINSAGRILWKVPLNERINGEVYMIDYFHNGKYQLLFAGRNYLHVLDRNGNYVERFPVKLRSPATSPLELYTYDNSQNYRLFIAGEDKMIYSYDKTGNVVKGWKPFHTPGIVSSQVSYLKAGRKDYLEVSDENSVYILDRSGNRKVNTKGSAAKALHSSVRLFQGKDQYIVFSAPDGKVTQLYFDGTIRKFSLGTFSIDHSFDYFDIDGDGFGEYVFIDKGKLYLYNHNRSEVFTRDFETPDLGGPINFIFSANDRKIGVIDINKKNIYLINKNGDTMKGFPLRGASMFSIGKLSEKSGWHLLVGGTDKFLYNYKIDTETK